MILLERYAGLGDGLFLNTLAFHLGERTRQRVLVGTNHPSIVRGNPWAVTLPCRTRLWGELWGVVLRRLHLIDKRIYLTYFNGPKHQPDAHILTVLSRAIGLEPAPVRPLLFLTATEKRHAALPADGKPWIAMQSAGLTSWTLNKEWFPDRFAAVAAALRATHRIVQLGAASDPELGADLDLRGRITPRAAAATLASCHAFVGQVGYLMHAAAAVGTRAVIVYGGFEAPWQSGYAWNENLYTALPCAPCWISGPCPCQRTCMDRITVADALSAVQRTLAAAAPLPVDA